MKAVSSGSSNSGSGITGILVSVFSTVCICLCSLTLEWNALGLIENAFSVFCDGVGSNGTLSMLDLRSNQVSHVGASELANALKRNSTLQTLGIPQF